MVTEGLGEDVGVCHVCRHFEGFAQSGFEHLWCSSGIAQCESGFRAIPRSPAVDFCFGASPRITAYPVSIGQHIGIVFLPLQALCKVAPQTSTMDAIHQRVVVVEFHHTRTTSEGTTEFAHDAVIVTRFGDIAKIGEDESMRHQRVDGTDRRVLHKVLVHQAVAISDPLFTVGALVSDFTIVIFLTPHRIGVLEPERRCPGAHCSVEENVGPDGFAHHAFCIDDTFCILIAIGIVFGASSREEITDTIKLEEAEIIVALVAEVGDCFGEDLVVFRVRELHATLPVPVSPAVVTTLSITTNRPKPSTDA